MNNSHVLAARSFLALDRTPPSELRLWQVGDNPTDYGVHKWTEASAAAVMGEYEARGNPIALDIEHGGPADENGDPREMAGYARLELRDGAPWLAFDWSRVGAEQIASGQRRYLSPEYGVDTETGEIRCLVRVSLVAEPGTHNAPVLASAAGNTSVVKREGEHMDPKILEALKAACESDDPKAALEDLIKQYEDPPKDSPDADTPSDAAASKEGKKLARAMLLAFENRGSRRPAPTANVNASAHARIDAFERAQLLEKHGANMPPAMRQWSRSAPIEGLRSYCAAVSATTAHIEPLEKVNATRGPANGLGRGSPSRLRAAMRPMDLRPEMSTTDLRVLAAHLGPSAEEWIHRHWIDPVESTHEPVTRATVGPVVEADGHLRVRGSLPAVQAARKAEAIKSIKGLAALGARG